MVADDERGVLTHVQSKLKAASSHCEPGTFDLHVLPNVALGGRCRRPPHRPPRDLADPGAAEAARPRRRAAAQRRSGRRPGDRPAPVQRSRTASTPRSLAEGVELARAVAASGPLGELLSGPAVPDALPSEAWTLFHPAGTCRMGAAGAADTVVDPDGRVQGVDGLRVADASILPTDPARQHAPDGARGGRGDGRAARRLTRCRIRCQAPDSPARGSRVRVRAGSVTEMGEKRPAGAHERHAGARHSRRMSDSVPGTRFAIRRRSGASTRATGCGRF